MSNREQDRYERRGKELVKELNDAVSTGRLVAGTHEYSEKMWLIDTLLKASSTHKKKD